MYDYKKISFSNGLRLILCNMRHVYSTTIEVCVGVGPQYETEKNRGVSHFLEHMAFEGTKKYPTSEKLANFIEGVGGRGWGATNKDNIVYAARVPSNQIGVGFEYINEILFNPILSKEVILKEKGIISEEINQRIDNINDHIWDVWLVHVYGKNSPLGAINTGSLDKVRTITREQLISHINTYYSPSNITIAVSGNISFKECEELANKYFGLLTGIKTPKPKSLKKNKQKDRLTILKYDIQQIQFILGFSNGVNYTNSDRYILRLIAFLLANGASSRLFKTLIYKHGLVYSVGADFWPFSDTGLFSIYGSCSLQNIYKVLNIINFEIKSLKNNPVDIAELQLSKNKIKSEAMFMCESTDMMADYLATQELLENEFLTLESFGNIIDKITSKDIIRVANMHFSKENLKAVLAGQITTDESNAITQILDK